MGSDGAQCFHTLTDVSRVMTKAQWDGERFGMICTTAINFKEWKVALEKLCTMTKKCDEETREMAKKFFSRVEFLQGIELTH